MRPLTRVEAIHICALSVWVATLVVGAVCAILGFRTMRLAEPALPGFASYDGEHWRLLAGMMADRVFFVTNGTSTSNKMVHQALLEPGDIVIADRNCHKSHHYGMVLAGAQPYYVEAFPLVEYSMYGAVPLRAVKQALLALKAAGRLHKVKLVTLTNCTFDGHVYDTRRVMEECLAIKPDLVFLWDEAWFGFARFSPFLRPRTAMGARAALKEAFADPAYLERYLAQEKALGADLDPADERVAETRLVPDPRKAKLRVVNPEDDDFVENEETNRDPFRSYLRLFSEKATPRVQQVPAVFDKFALEELSLIAVVSGIPQPRAMFRDPSGFGQSIKRGDYVSKAAARVTKILSDRVILELTETTPTGEPRALEKAILVNPEGVSK